MLKFLRKNNKKVLAVVGVFLMISFVATTRTFNGGGNRGQLTVVGHVGDTPIHEADVENARAEWRLLTTVLQAQNPSDGKWVPILQTNQFAYLAPLATDGRLFLLLQMEADRMGIVVSQDPLATIEQAGFGILQPDGTIAQPTHLPDDDEREQLTHAVAGFVKILSAEARAAQAVKVSRPMEMTAVAAEQQELQAKVVPFMARDFIAKVPAPTTQQLQAQFEKFADVEPAAPADSEQPVDGYKYPRRVAVQYLAVSRESLRDAVKQSKSDYDWEVAARSFYLKHEIEFATTQPANSPSTLPSLSLSPTTAPAIVTRPFEQVRNEVMDRVMAPDVDALSDRVQKMILSTMSGDWAAYHAATAASRPASASSLGPPYTDYSYLTALATRLQHDAKVFPRTEQLPQLMSAAELNKLPGIGDSHAGEFMDFGSVATEPTLLPFQPSPVMKDGTDTLYFFRDTQISDAHRPASMDEVKAVVESDWRKTTAMDLAKAAADQLVAAAKTSSLAAAANAANKPLITTGFFSDNEEPITNLSLKPGSIATFKHDVANLLANLAAKQPAVTRIDLPEDSETVAAQLTGVRPEWTPSDKLMMQDQLSMQLERTFASRIRQTWFDLPHVESRMNYKDAKL